MQTFFIKRDLTDEGRKYFTPLLRKFLAFSDRNGRTPLTPLLRKFLAFSDRNGRTPLEKMLPRWLAALKKAI